MPYSPTNRKLDPILRSLSHHVHMASIELIPIRRPDGTIVLQGVSVGFGERLRRLLRKLAHHA